MYADDGHKEHLETIKTPVFDADGHLKGVLGIARDITERKKNEQEKIEAYLALEEHKNWLWLARLQERWPMILIMFLGSSWDNPK